MHRVDFMQVFHFINAKYGLAAIERKRLKISRLNELNDPFELLGVSLKERHFRRAFTNLKHEFSQNKGILCFSRSWHNPVLWSHYADRHRGLCLGFDIAKRHLVPVSYSAKRLAISDNWLKRARAERENDILRFLCAKFEHWKYEGEMRLFLRLTEKDEETGHYFKEFLSDIRLNKVIIGANSIITKDQITNALAGYGNPVEILKGRAAFRTFSVVRDLSWC